MSQHNWTVSPYRQLQNSAALNYNVRCGFWLNKSSFSQTKSSTFNWIRSSLAFCDCSSVQHSCRLSLLRRVSGFRYIDPPRVVTEKAEVKRSADLSHFKLLRRRESGDQKFTELWRWVSDKYLNNWQIRTQDLAIYKVGQYRRPLYIVIKALLSAEKASMLSFLKSCWFCLLFLECFNYKKT